MIFWCWHFGIETNSDGIGFGQGARHLEPRHEAMMQQLGGDDSNQGHLVRLADRPSLRHFYGKLADRRRLEQSNPAAFSFFGDNNSLTYSWAGWPKKQR